MNQNSLVAGARHAANTIQRAERLNISNLSRLAYFLVRAPSSAGGTDWALIARRVEARPSPLRSSSFWKLSRIQAVIALESSVISRTQGITEQRRDQ